MILSAYAFFAFPLLAFAAPVERCPSTYSTKPSAVIPWAPVKSPLSVDQSAIYNSTYYISDRSIAGVHVVDINTKSQVKTIGGFFKGVFAPNGSVLEAPGPEGMLVVANNNELWVGDADGSVKVIDMFTNKIVADIKTGSIHRADEFAYDGETSTVVVTNNDVPIPFITVVSSTNRRILGKILVPGASSIEQPVFNKVLQKFYISVPSYPDIPALTGGAICSLNLETMIIDETFAVPECIPAGIAFPDQHSTNLFIGCSAHQIATYSYAASYVMNVRNGHIIANISMLSGIDQVVYSEKTNAFYAAAKDMTIDGRNGSTPTPLVGIVDAETLTLKQTIPTNDTVLAHAVSVDELDGRVFVPIRQLGIAVFSPAS